MTEINHRNGITLRRGKGCGAALCALFNQRDCAMTRNRSKTRKRMARGGERSRRTTKTMKSKQPIPRTEEVMESRMNPNPQELGGKNRPSPLQQREILDNSPLPRCRLFWKALWERTEHCVQALAWDDSREGRWSTPLSAKREKHDPVTSLSGGNRRRTWATPAGRGDRLSTPPPAPDWGNRGNNPPKA